ncbi:MAG: hypothetical protein ABJA78_14890 [Ferruginibacter sp.]
MKKFINFSSWLFAFAITGALIFTGCKKESSTVTTSTDSSDDVTATMEATSADIESSNTFDDVFNITASMNTSQVGEDLGVGVNVSGLFNLGGREDSAARCFTISVVPAIPHVFPKTVTIDFGPGCLCRDGKYRKGKIVTIYTAPMVIPGSKVSSTFVGYNVDSFAIEGTHITENTSTSNMQGWKVTVIDAKITNSNNSKWKKWNSIRQVTQSEGNGTPGFPLDDVYKITGAATGSNSAGHQWTSVITDALIKKFTCQWIVKGSVRIDRDGMQALLDYGNGNCDNQATITINGTTHPITLQ